jgi:hypothetical protein
MSIAMVEDAGKECSDEAGLVDPQMRGVLLRPNFIQRHVGVLTSRAMLAAHLLFASVSGIVVLLTVPDKSAVDSYDTCEQLTSHALLPSLIVIYSLTLMLAWRVREVNDSFRIKEELKRQGVIEAIHTVWVVFVSQAFILFSPLAHVVSVSNPMCV